MGALVTVYATPATYVATQLAAYSDMSDVLNELQPLGYSGNLSMDVAGNWLMWFQSENQNASWNAKIGDWIIVKNGAIASSIPAAQASALYTTTPPS